MKGGTYEYICRPMYRYQIDNIPNDIDVLPRYAVIRVRVLLEQLDRLRLVPLNVFVDRVFVRE